jgi:adenine specific DNA methylase Mod
LTLTKRLPKLKEYILFYKKNSTSNLMLNEIKIPKEKWDDEYRILVTGVSKEELKIIKDLMNSDNISEEEINKADDICQRMEFSNVNTIIKDFKKIDEKLDFLHKNSYRILRDVATSGGAKRIADEKRDVFNINKSAFLIKTPRDKIYLMRGDYNKESKQPRMKMLFADQYLDVNVGDFWHDIKTTGLGAEGEIEFLNGKKPLRLITRLLRLNSKNIKVLDFFAGSGTTGHAVMELNKEDGGNRKYILCTNNENNICEEVTYQRMKNIQEELPHNLKYYKTDFIKRFSNEEEILSYRLLDHIKEMVELENMCEIDSEERIIILYDEDLDDLMGKGLKENITIYLPSYLLISRETEDKLLEKNIEIVDIPDYYFLEELKEVKEI